MAEFTLMSGPAKIALPETENTVRDAELNVLNATTNPEDILTVLQVEATNASGAPHLSGQDVSQRDADDVDRLEQASRTLETRGDVLERMVEGGETITGQLRDNLAIQEAGTRESHERSTAIEVSDATPGEKADAYHALSQDLMDLQSRDAEARLEIDSVNLDTARDVVDLLGQSETADQGVISAAAERIEQLQDRLDDKRDHLLVTEEDRAAADALSRVATPADMLAALEGQMTSKPVADPHGDVLVNAKQADFIDERVQQSKDFEATKIAEISDRQGEMRDHLANEGKTFDQVGQDERADYYADILHADADRFAEHGQLKIDIEEAFIESGHHMVNDVDAENDEISDGVILADRDKLDELSERLDGERASHDQQSQLMHLLADEVSGRVRGGESFAEAREAVLQAHHDDVPLDLQASGHDNASVSGSQATPVHGDASLATQE